jgi:sarcosine oxidase subunit alpha
MENRRINRALVNRQWISDPDKPITINFEGKQIAAFEGESVAIALYANGIDLISHSMKYYRPQGIRCLSGHCASCLMRINNIPNERACQIKVKEGMHVERQTKGRPSLMKPVDVMAKLFPDGFDYHRLFTSPKIVSKVFNTVVHSISGQGHLPEQSVDPRSIKESSLYPRFLIIGAGPAGLGAAQVLDQAGEDTLLVEDQSELGGRLLHSFDQLDEHVFQYSDPLSLALDLEEVVDKSKSIKRLKGKVLAYFEDEKCFFCIGEDQVWRIYPQNVIFATGSYDKAPLFENNSIAGIYSIRAAEKLINLYGVSPGKKILLVNLGAYLTRVIPMMRELEIDVCGIIEEEIQPSYFNQVSNIINEYSIQSFWGDKVVAAYGN